MFGSIGSNRATVENPHMRLLAFVFAVCGCGGPAAAQNWQEYS
jgi:hypothetical protein